MKRLPGRRATEIWFEGIDVGDDDISKIRPSKEVEAKRVNMLRSLAKTMAGLQSLEFKSIGMLAFPDGDSSQPPYVAHKFFWKGERDLTNEALESDTQVDQEGPSSSEYLNCPLDQMCPRMDSELLDTLDEDTRFYGLGLRKIRDILLAHPIINNSKSPDAEASEGETFVLKIGLELGDILVDDDGHVTGILDWDNMVTAPRCIGYASYPDFLCYDWQDSITKSESPHMGDQLPHYRQIYAKAMEETGCPDARFTAKSHKYLAIEDSMSLLMKFNLLVELIFHEISELRYVDVEDFVTCLGMDDGSGREEFLTEKWLTEKIGEVLDI